MDDNLPSTEPAGTLDPPPPTPPVATGAISPVPRDPYRRAEVKLDDAAEFVGTVARRALDLLDELGDAIAESMGLRV